MKGGIWRAKDSIHCLAGATPTYDVDMTNISQPHEDALILSLDINIHWVRRILVDPRSAVDLMLPSVLVQMGYKPSTLHPPEELLLVSRGHSLRLLGKWCCQSSLGW